MRSGEQHVAYLGLGSNLGDKEDYLRQARQLLQTPEIRISRGSSIYKTSPVDYLDQDWFLNQVIEATTALSPLDLLTHCQGVENRLGRSRTIEKGPRTIDIDFLFFDNEILSTARLTLPHPHIAERKFVLVPLNEIAPTLIHPVLKKSVRELLEERRSDSASVELWS